MTPPFQVGSPFSSPLPYRRRPRPPCLPPPPRLRSLGPNALFACLARGRRLPVRHELLGGLPLLDTGGGVYLVHPVHDLPALRAEVPAAGRPDRRRTGRQREHHFAGYREYRELVPGWEDATPREKSGLLSPAFRSRRHTGRNRKGSCSGCPVRVPALSGYSFWHIYSLWQMCTSINTRTIHRDACLLPHAIPAARSSAFP